MWMLFCLFLLSFQDHDKAPERAAPYYPTPQVVVEQMLKLGGLRRGEKLYDLGSGDGRIVMLGAAKFGAKAVGVELDHGLVQQSRASIAKLKLHPAAQIMEGDLFEQDYSDADLITVYLLPVTNIRLSPVLEKKLKKGARVVCHDFEFTEWKPEKTETIEDNEGRSHTLFLYRR
ncbi:class I SAM-dependent methyltransferase [Bryobacter aggregatus]|uniref:class I SAM-dependent methyltransferase n=1 Tax=Bryobacter aggregatus TaxID=360054 RepID=UPI0005609F38|nr:50S ribosomal protein L11 methyltransferase [Bryobacter aggregatus]